MYSQYARQYNFLECVIANDFDNVAVKCACETTTADSENARTPLPHSHSKNTHHANPDEWYTSVQFVAPGVGAGLNLQSYIDLQVPSYREGALHAIDHPPSFFRDSFV